MNSYPTMVRRALELCVLACFASAPARAQTELLVFDGSAAGDRFGEAVCAAGDIDGDGFGDLVIGAPYNDATATNAGQVVVISGRSHQVIRVWSGSAVNGRFGAALAGCGDLDADGNADVVVAAPGINGGPNGSVVVISGASGSALRTWSGAPAFGDDVDSGRDASGDGIPDVLIGSSLDGELFLYDGATGALLRQHSIGGFAFGASVAFIGDVTGDGRAEYAASDPDTWGSVFAFRADSGVQLWSNTGGFGDELGSALSAVADLSGDGLPDVLAGAEDEGSFGSDGRGYVRVLDGASGAALDTVHGANVNDHLGAAFAAAGDLDGDGLGDFVVGQALSSAGHAAQVRRGSDRGVIATLPPPGASDGWGRALAFGDVSGDQLADVIVSAPQRDSAGADSGSVYVFSVVRKPTAYCESETNSLGCTPAISASGTASATLGSPFDIGATAVINNKSGLLFYSFKPRQTPFQGGHMCVVAPTKRTGVQSSGGNPPPNDCSGAFTLDFNARIQSGVDPELVAGEEVFAQYWSRDPADGSTTNLSDALAFWIAP